MAFSQCCGGHVAFTKRSPNIMVTSTGMGVDTLIGITSVATDDSESNVMATPNSSFVGMPVGCVMRIQDDFMYNQNSFTDIQLACTVSEERLNTLAARLLSGDPIDDEGKTKACCAHGDDGCNGDVATAGDAFPPGWIHFGNDWQPENIYDGHNDASDVCESPTNGFHSFLIDNRTPATVDHVAIPIPSNEFFVGNSSSVCQSADAIANQNSGAAIPQLNRESETKVNTGFFHSDSTVGSLAFDGAADEVVVADGVPDACEHRKTIGFRIDETKSAPSRKQKKGKPRTPKRKRKPEHSALQRKHINRQEQGQCHTLHQGRGHFRRAAPTYPDICKRYRRKQRRRRQSSKHYHAVDSASQHAVTHDGVIFEYVECQMESAEESPERKRQKRGPLFSCSAAKRRSRWCSVRCLQRQ